MNTMQSLMFATPITRRALMDERTQPATRILQEGRMAITPDLAKQILEKLNYISQRPVLRHHVAKLASLMERGAWLEGTQIAFATLPDQSVVLINGQHRLHAVAQSGVTIDAQILLIPVADTDECHAAYYRFDTVQKGRSIATIVASAGIADREGIPRDYARSAMAAVVFIALGLRDVHGAQRDPILSTPDGQLHAAENWWPEIKTYSSIKTGAQFIRRKFLNGSTMAVALVTLKHQPALALKFWTAVGGDDGLAANDPCKALLKDWQARTIKITAHVGMGVASRAWNAYFRGEKMHHIKMAPDSEFFVLGTPFNVARK